MTRFTLVTLALVALSSVTLVSAQEESEQGEGSWAFDSKTPFQLACAGSLILPDGEEPAKPPVPNGVLLPDSKLIFLLMEEEDAPLDEATKKRNREWFKKWRFENQFKDVTLTPLWARNEGDFTPEILEQLFPNEEGYSPIPLEHRLKFFYRSEPSDEEAHEKSLLMEALLDPTAEAEGRLPGTSLFFHGRQTRGIIKGYPGGTFGTKPKESETGFSPKSEGNLSVEEKGPSTGWGESPAEPTSSEVETAETQLDNDWMKWTAVYLLLGGILCVAIWSLCVQVVHLRETRVLAQRIPQDLEQRLPSAARARAQASSQARDQETRRI